MSQYTVTTQAHFIFSKFSLSEKKGGFHLLVFLIPFSSYSNKKVAIIREVYDGENAYESFEYELEKALESECQLIVIEPTKLGDETSRWISVGNCLHKTSAISGVAAILTGKVIIFTSNIFQLRKIQKVL